MRKYFRRMATSLTLRIGAVIIFVEIVVLAITGVIYIRRFSDEIDRRMETQIQIPGALMKRGLLNYQSVSDKDIMTEMVGENFTDGFVASTNGVIYYSLNPDYYGRNVHDIPEMEFRDLFNQELLDTVVLTS